MAAVPRGYLGAWLDWFVGWKAGLPKELGNYTIEALRVPLDDDIKVSADLYRPVAKPIGTILVRSPYGIGTALATANARCFAARGYQVLFSSCRGTTTASDGIFDGARCEEMDGQAVVAWMRKQAWYTGSFATLGPSYLGYVQWALMSNPPPDMKAAIINTGPHDFSNFAWETGAFNSDCLVWADFQTGLQHGSKIPAPLFPYIKGWRLRAVLDQVPLIDGLERYFAKDRPIWMLQTMTMPDLNAAFWKPWQHSDAFEKAQKHKIPILLTAGWYDLLMPSVMEQYRRLAEIDSNVALTVGPWTHFDAGGRNTMTETLDWLDAYLSSRRDDDGRPSPVRAYITGKDEWRRLSKWPPPTTTYELFLGPKSLSGGGPPPDTPDSQFTFDPTHPTPSTGVPLLFDAVKHNENTSLTKRSDVLAFTTQPLNENVEVCGQPFVNLHHSSNNPHVDLLVVLSEVHPNGKSYHITEKFLRLPPDRDRKSGPLQVFLHDCGHMFRKGNRISLLVAGGSHPRFLRNTGTNENILTSTALQSSVHVVSHNTSAMSKLVLPVTRSA